MNSTCGTGSAIVVGEETPVPPGTVDDGELARPPADGPPPVAVEALEPGLLLVRPADPRFLDGEPDTCRDPIPVPDEPPGLLTDEVFDEPDCEPVACDATEVALLVP